MKYFHRLAAVAISAAFFIAPALAQTSGTVSNHAVAIGKGPGVTGFGSAGPGAFGTCLAGNGASADPSFSTCGSVTNIAALKAINVTASTRIYVAGYTSEGDGGGGWFYGNTGSATSDNGGTVIAPNTGSGRWLRAVDMPGRASVKWFGAKGDGTTNDAAAILATAAWLSNDSTMEFPSGNYLCATTCLKYVNGSGIKIIGSSASNSAFPQTSIVTYTAATGPLMKLDGVEGVEVSNISLKYNNASYTGDLVDARQVTGVILTTSIHFHDFTLTGTSGTAVGANSLFRMGATLKVVLEHGFIQLAIRGVENSGVEGAVNDVEINDVWFQGISSQPILAAGNNWTVRNNPVEPLSTGTNAGFFFTSAPCYGCSLQSNNIGDATGTGTWIDLTGGAFIGGSITNNQIDQTHQGTSSVAIKLGSSVGVDVLGNALFIPTGGTSPINAASATHVTILSNNCYVTNSSTTPCNILSGSNPASGTWDNNDASGINISSLSLATPLSAISGGFGISVNGSSGVPLFATGTVTFTGTSGTGNFARVTSPTFVTPTLGAASFTSLQNSANNLATITVEKGGGDVFMTRFNAGNPRFGIGIGGSSGTAFLGNNLVWSGSGNVWNFDRTGTAALFGNLSGASDANYFCGATGTAGASSGFDTALGCGFSITSTGELSFNSAGIPTIASGACGTGSNGVVTSGTNQAGLVTIGASATTTCTINFSRTLGRVPAACMITPQNAAAAATGTTVARVSSISTSQWVITGTALANAAYYYHCI